MLSHLSPNPSAMRIIVDSICSRLRLNSSLAHSLAGACTRHPGKAAVTTIRISPPRICISARRDLPFFCPQLLGRRRGPRGRTAERGLSAAHFIYFPYGKPMSKTHGLAVFRRLRPITACALPSPPICTGVTTSGATKRLGASSSCWKPTRPMSCFWAATRGPKIISANACGFFKLLVARKPWCRATMTSGCLPTTHAAIRSTFIKIIYQTYAPLMAFTIWITRPCCCRIRGSQSPARSTGTITRGPWRNCSAKHPIGSGVCKPSPSRAAGTTTGALCAGPWTTPALQHSSSMRSANTSTRRFKRLTRCLSSLIIRRFMG